MLPWLAGNQERLEIFRAVDDGPQCPGYLHPRTAATLSHLPIGKIPQAAAAARQRSPSSPSALAATSGPCAAWPPATTTASRAMAEAKTTVARWRGGQFLVRPVLGRHHRCGRERPAGAVRAVHRRPRHLHYLLPNYLGGSLLCMLPSGRTLTYRDIRRERIAELDDDDKPTGKTSGIKLRFSRGYGPCQSVARRHVLREHRPRRRWPLTSCAARWCGWRRGGLLHSDSYPR